MIVAVKFRADRLQRCGQVGLGTSKFRNGTSCDQKRTPKIPGRITRYPLGTVTRLNPNLYDYHMHVNVVLSRLFVGVIMSLLESKSQPTITCGTVMVTTRAGAITTMWKEEANCFHLTPKTMSGDCCWWYLRFGLLTWCVVCY